MTEVVVQIQGQDVLAGRLWSHRKGSAESATFAYESDYLGRSDAYALDPALPLRTGQYQTEVGQALFGGLTDCAPDRWGRRLINRALRQGVTDVSGGGGGSRQFAEIEYLLGVRDDMRQGALRFREPESGLFLASEATGVPPLVELPRLLNAAAKLERDQPSDDDLRLLLRGGSSLGGARPKAHVLDPHGVVSIAKFPSRDDEWDKVTWEAVTHELAGRADLRVPNAHLHTIAGKPVFVVQRFDRADGYARIGYSSAMTMLQAGDREPRTYLEMAGVIERESPAASADLRELWCRIIFYRLISNTDDHLRNHGFLRSTTAGWELSPAFDINPDPARDEFATSVDGETRGSIQTLIDVADLFALKDAEARDLLNRIQSAVDGWQQVAEAFGLTKTEISDMAPAFEHEEATSARSAGATHQTVSKS